MTLQDKNLNNLCSTTYKDCSGICPFCFGVRQGDPLFVLIYTFNIYTCNILNCAILSCCKAVTPPKIW